jgi:hypothetical protein
MVTILPFERDDPVRGRSTRHTNHARPSLIASDQRPQSRANLTGAVGKAHPAQESAQTATSFATLNFFPRISTHRRNHRASLG